MKALDSFRKAMAIKEQQNAPHDTFSFGVVLASTSTGCTVLFDQEVTPGTKAYRWLTSRQPQPGERVMLAWVSKTYIILGTAPGRALNTSWASPPLGTHMTAFASPYWGPQYLSLSTGEIQVEGLVAFTGAISPGTVLFNLPVGFRPNVQQVFRTPCGTSGGTVDTSTRLDVSTAGDVWAQPAFVASDWVSVKCSFVAGG